MSNFKKYAENLIKDLEKYEIMYQSKAFPGKKVVADGKKLLREILQTQSASEFFKKVSEDYEDYLDLGDDLEPVHNFFTGGQKAIFETALDLMQIYEESKTFIADQEVENVVDQIKAILKKDAPYRDIPKLPEYIEKFRDLYNALLTSMEAPIKEVVDDAKARVFEELEAKSYKGEVSANYRERFEELYQKLESCNNVASLQNIRVEADALKMRILNDMAKRDEMLAREAARKAEEERNKVIAAESGNEADRVAEPVIPAPKVKTRKSVSIRSINRSASWQVETAADVDKYLGELRERILKELAEDTIVNIEF